MSESGGLQRIPIRAGKEVGVDIDSIGAQAISLIMGFTPMTRASADCRWRAVLAARCSALAMIQLRARLSAAWCGAAGAGATSKLASALERMPASHAVVPG